MYRLRRLCSRDFDFKDAISKLRERCINSGHNQGLVDEILVQADTLDRLLTPRIKDNADANLRIIRWVILSGTS